MAPEEAIMTTQNIDFVQKVGLKYWSGYYNILKL